MYKTSKHFKAMPIVWFLMVASAVPSTALVVEGKYLSALAYICLFITSTALFWLTILAEIEEANLNGYRDGVKYNLEELEREHS